MLTANKTIHDYNLKYRKKDKPTDILSFSFYPDLKPGERIEVENAEAKNLGDLVISPEYIQTQLPELKTTLDKRLQRLLVHGVCHLLGYDHVEDKDFDMMDKKEQEIMQKLNLK